MFELEIVSVKCERCEQMVSAHDGQEHPCWQEEQEMQALEQQMWEEYQNGRDKPSEEDVEPVCRHCGAKLFAPDPTHICRAKQEF